jgi:hypothetical protein
VARQICPGGLTMQLQSLVRACRARSTRLLAGLLVAAGLALTGCAGEDTSGFAASYDAVTVDYRAALEQAQAAGRAADAAADPVAVYEQLRSATREAVERYRSLDAPDAAAPAFDELTDGLDAQVEALDRVLSAAQNDDTPAVRAGLSDYAAAIGAWQSARTRVDAALDKGPARAGP